MTPSTDPCSLIPAPHPLAQLTNSSQNPFTVKHWPLSLTTSALLIIIILSTAAAQDPTPEASDQRPVARFGVIESTENPGEADSLGAGWTRLIFHWAEIQPNSPDDWLPKYDLDQLAQEIASGRQVVGLLIGIPDWARDQNKLPQGLWLDHDDDLGDKTNTWAQYVRTVVTTYAGTIDHWIIWNEPDILETEIAHTWDGSVADFAQLQRVAYLVAKEANPEAVIHLSAFTYWADYYAGTEQYIDRLLDEIQSDPQAAASNHYFDVASAHLYFQPDQIHDLLTLFTQAMRSRGLDQPIWLVETNAPPINDPDWPVPDWTLSVTQREQAAFIPQALASAFAAGAERAAVYKLQDTEDDRAANPEPFGLLRMDGSRRPAFDTYRIAVKQLQGAFNVERERWNEVASIRFDQPGQTTTVLYSRLPQPQQAGVAASSNTALLMDMFGTRQVITSTNGIYSVDLPAARCSQSIADYCMIGGHTYYLIQEADTVPPSPTPESSSTPIPSNTPSLTPSQTPSQTPSTKPTETPSQTPSKTPSETPSNESAPTDRPAPLPSATSLSETSPSTGDQPTENSNLLYGLIAPLSIAGIIIIYAIIRRLRQ